MVFIWYVYSLGFWYVMILLNPIRISQTISFPTLIDSVKNVRHPLLQHSFFLVSMTPEHNGSPPTFWLFLLRFLCGWFFSLPITEMLDIPKFCYGHLFFSLFLFFLVYCIHSQTLIIILVAITLRSVPLAQLSSLCIRHLYVND